MRQSLFCCTLSILIFCGTSCLTAQIEQELVTAGKDTSLLIRAADARLRLAQADLGIALDSNRRVPSNVSGPELAVSKEQYNQAILASSGGLEKIRLCNAEEKVRVAKLNYERSKTLRDKDAMSEFGVKRAKLRYELSKLNLALLKNPENYVTLIEALQAQIDQLGQDTVSLDLRITKLESTNF